MIMVEVTLPYLFLKNKAADAVEPITLIPNNVKQKESMFRAFICLNGACNIIIFSAQKC